MSVVSVPSTVTSAPRFAASARFWVCLAVLGGTAVLWPMALRALDYHTRKEPVPLKKSLRFFDWQGLAPRYRLAEVQPPDLTEEMIHSLDTREYFMCRLVDTALPPSDPAAAVDIAITYYTGKPDLVPHVPTECMVAGGYDLVEDREDVPIRVTGIGARNDTVPLHLSVFDAPRMGDNLERRGVTVAYFFHTNGDYCSSRLDVRLRMSNLLERYAYFSKIEVKFSSADMRTSADRDQTLAALPPLLERLMPLLLRDHFNWDELHAAAGSAADGDQARTRAGNGA
jgi:hypothetical protein